MIALIFGKHSEDITNSIKRNSDVSEVYPYENIKSFLTASAQRGYRYERIVLKAGTYNMAADLQNLYTFLTEKKYNTSVVLAYRTTVEDDVDLADAFCNIFQSPIYTDIGITGSMQVDVSLMIRLCSTTIDGLRMQYGTRKDILFGTENVRVGNSVAEEIANTQEMESSRCQKLLGLTGGVIKEFKIGGMFRKGLSKSQVNEVLDLVGEAKASIQSL